jgi:hypothetical protein
MTPNTFRVIGRVPNRCAAQSHIGAAELNSTGVNT